MTGRTPGHSAAGSTPAAAPVPGSAPVPGPVPGPAPEPRTLGALLRGAAREHGHRVAWVFPHATRPRWTFAEIDAAVDRISAFLRRSTAPGDRVAVMLPNVPEFPLLWLAAARSGRTVVPVNTQARTADAAHLLRDAGPRLAVTTPAYADVLAAAAGQAGLTGFTVVPADDLPAGPAGPDSSGVPEPGEAGVAGRPGESGDSADSAAPGSPVNIQYTSGTTGLPKGCMLSHRYWLTIAHALRTNFPRLDADDVLYTAQPFSYMDPQWNVVAALRSGARLVVADRFSASRMWADIRAHGVTVFYCLGMMPAALLAQPPHPDDRNHAVRAVLASGIPTGLHRALEERWGVPWYEAFGMTESGADLVVTPEDHDQTVGTGCIGRPQPGKRIDIVDDAGRPVEPGQPGELVISGEGLMDGYWGQPEATARVLRAGRLHTGDRVRADAEGRIYYLTRTKDMVRRSGENVSAREVEAVVESHPAVRTAAVVPEPDAVRGEEVKVFVVPAGGERPDPRDLLEFCRERLASFKVPRYWCVRSELPRTPSERVAKGELRADRGPCWDAAARPAEPPPPAGGTAGGRP
ncbi:AMP-binding protein [Streptomyces sp. F63]|uniref:AMP-binding protein n=1 Tax=Streptomyces sp. F63 TaxID=2824887 RepID=UPI001B36E2D5|nr:AMP-binding protein [Streptomyces sp. F63]MBQ0987273.1 AMP-binding protein [Streptomyces sp. F63]